MGRRGHSSQAVFGPIGLLDQPPGCAGEGWGCKFSRRWPLLLSPTPQPPAGLRCQCIPEMDPHNRRGWGVGVSPLPWSWRGDAGFPARASGVYKRKPGQGNQGCDFHNYCVIVNFPALIIALCLSKKMPLLSVSEYTAAFRGKGEPRLQFTVKWFRKK